MPRFCPQCGAKIPDGAKTCPSCGKHPEDDVQIFTPHKKDTGEVRQAKNLRRVAALGVCAVLLCGALIAIGHAAKSNTPEKAASEFQAALAAGDYDRLCAVTKPAGDEAFTEEALAPMISLYRESAAFRQQTAQLSKTDSACLHLERRSAFPLSPYCVRIDPCKLSVVSNIAGASVTAGGVQAQTQAQADRTQSLEDAAYAQDASNLVSAAAEFDTLYPGRYDLDVSYTSSLGQSFSKSASINLMQPSQTELDLDYTGLYVWNSSSMDVFLTVDGQNYGTLSAGAALELAPLHEESIVTANCTTEAGETLSKSVPASSRSFEILFSLGNVDIYNDYHTDMLVSLGGAEYCTIPAKTLQTVSGISLGSTLTFTLAGTDVFSPYDYQLVYDYDSICPILDLSEQSELAVCAVLQDALSSAPLTKEHDGLLGGLDRLLAENGWPRSEVVVSDVTVENVYAVEPYDGGMRLSLDGFYTCTNITLPDTAAMPAPEDDVSQAEDGAESPDTWEEQADAEEIAPVSVQNPQYKGFYATVVYDGEDWSLAES